MNRDDELTLLGILEGQLGERQHALGGLHLGEGASRSLHAEMVALQHRATELEEADRGADPAESPRHRRPRGRVQRAIDLLTDRHRDASPSQ